MSSAGIYLHIPFCLRKCPYCDFYSVPLSASQKRRYLEALVREMGRTEGRPAADTVYLGGGTPSLLSGDDFSRLIAAVQTYFSLSPDAELTAELNPGDVTPQLLSALASAGFNRLSLGVQSFDDAMLRLLGRRHTAERAVSAFHLAREAGFSNISIDLMLALPGQTPAALLAECHATAALAPEHISAYLLKLEPGTPFGKHPPAHMPDDDAAAELYLLAAQALEQAGYRHYEISSYARPGLESRHNLKYWLLEDYYAFGAAAAACVGGRRTRYAADIDAFIDGRPPIDEGPVTAEDALICLLRTDRGLDLAAYAGRFGPLTENQRQLIDRCTEAGYLTRSGSRIAFTDRGFLVSNSILARLI